MSLDPALRDDLAAKLADARADRTPCALETALGHRFGAKGLSEEDAYQIQQALLEVELARGERLAGAKVGATNEVVQQMLRCSGPFFGWLFESGRIAANGSVDVSRLISPRIECEVAIGLAQDLSGPGVSADDVVVAAAWAAATFEIIDCRVAGPGRAPTVGEIIADNSGSAAFVVGDLRLPPPAVDLSSLTVSMTRNGEPLVTGTTHAVMDGNPAASVAWLANRLAESGTMLSAGMVVLTGAMAPPQVITAGDSFEADFGALGRFGVRFRA
jgi:2-keto-4-pentenoate hydratase